MQLYEYTWKYTFKNVFVMLSDHSKWTGEGDEEWLKTKKNKIYTFSNVFYMLFK